MNTEAKKNCLDFVTIRYFSCHKFFFPCNKNFFLQEEKNSSAKKNIFAVRKKSDHQKIKKKILGVQ